jgi:coenzyme F420-reducing hydrogenase gamma subunit
LANLVEIDTFPLVSSSCGKHDIFDVALVEGALTTPAEIERLLALRRKSRFLMAVGACALKGGINTLAKGERRKPLTSVYGDQCTEWNMFPPQPIDHFVKVDWFIPGCPPERHELLQTFGALIHYGWPSRQVMAVCMECRINENRCLLLEDQGSCLGPVTQAGCNAICPGQGVPCEGCRGIMQEANRGEMYQLLIKAGFTDKEICHRLERFGEAYYDPPNC